VAAQRAFLDGNGAPLRSKTTYRARKDRKGIRQSRHWLLHTALSILDDSSEAGFLWLRVLMTLLTWMPELVLPPDKTETAPGRAGTSTENDWTYLLDRTAIIRVEQLIKNDSFLPGCSP
jgi:hypothetical protein